MYRGEVRLAVVDIDLWNTEGGLRPPLSSGAACSTLIVRAAQLVLGRADEVEQIARLLQVHRHAVADVGDLPQRADQQRMAEFESSAARRWRS